jgi:hypothetical protein
MSSAQAIHAAIEDYMNDNIDDLNAMFGVKGWTYHDLPNMTRPFFDKFNKTVGEENIKYLTYMSREINGVNTARGQILLSPEGLRRVQEYVQEETQG